MSCHGMVVYRIAPVIQKSPYPLLLACDCVLCIHLLRVLAVFPCLFTCFISQVSVSFVTLFYALQGEVEMPLSF
jgi:hypothetical protein